MTTYTTIHSDLLIASYLDGTIAGDACEQLLRRLATSPRTRELLTAAEDSAAHEQPGQAPAPIPAHLLRQAEALYPVRDGSLRIVLAMLKDFIKVVACPDVYSLLHQEQACCVRGGSTMPVSPRVVMARVFDTIQVEVEAERPLQGTGCTIRLTVSPTQPRMARNRFKVFLSSAGRELYSGTLENDAVAFEDVGSGDYMITIKNHLKIIGEIALKLEDDTNGGYHGQH